MLGGRVGVAVLGIGLGINGVTDFTGPFRAILGDSTLDLTQETGKFILLVWLSLVLMLLVLLVWRIRRLTAGSILRGLILVLVRLRCEL